MADFHAQPCHRCITSTGYVGGFLGDSKDAPSGQNQSQKLELLRDEGVTFDSQGYLVDSDRWWDSFTT